MSTGNGIGTKRISHAMTLAALALVALVLTTATPAEARGGHRHESRHGMVQPHPSHGMGGAYYIPQHIYAPDFVTYGPWYAGRAYYGPHRHYHASYQFPVWVDGAIVYRPYTYCGDHMFVAATLPMPRLAIGLDLGPHVRVYGEVPLVRGGYGY